MSASKRTDRDIEAINVLGSYLDDEPDDVLMAFVEGQEVDYPGSALKLLWSIDHLLSAEFSTGELGLVLLDNLGRMIEADSPAGLDAAAVEWLTEFRKEVLEIVLRIERSQLSDDES